MNVALILAGGSGTRAQTGIPKQFVEVHGKPLIIYTLEKFQICDEIDEICIVCHEAWKQKMWNYAKQFHIKKLTKVCNGGRTGLESVLNGITFLEELKGEDLVLIHDAVRPFVDEISITNCIEVAQKYDVAVSAIACVETLVQADENGFSNQMISRDSLYRILTPQAFKLRILRSFFTNVEVINCHEPSIFALYMSKGNPIYCSIGCEKNIKITYCEDIEFFKKMFE